MSVWQQTGRAGRIGDRNLRRTSFAMWEENGRAKPSCDSNGAQGRNRTTDTAIFSRMLYQLSYLGVLQRGAKAHRAGGL